ncbi:MAG: hypothetical protein A3D28_00840 [Omnitrophica bacterium RIFCSPHIGHO2_02_FULL_63_14]|nr:MAG: hypothetical protein A3D28_00840 [Omnitrophica bacterium RIFCSPHIGHO2_02_FULL_63_14]
MLMGSVEIQFDLALVEEAVFLELKRREASGDRRLAETFHAQRSRLYDATGAADEREARFRQLAERCFYELGFSELVTKRFKECPLVAAQVQMATVQRVWSRKEERVELYVRPTTLLLGLQAARYLNRDELVAFLRYELMHISDMLDPSFAYEPHPEFGGECETEDDLTRERFRLLWNVWVAGRMRRNEWPLPGAEQSRRGLDRAFASWEPRRRGAVLQDLGSRNRCTQRELLELAKDERLTRMLGAGGVRCPLCHFPTRDGIRVWDGELAPIAQAIHADHPDWTPTQGACVQCADLYRARVYAVG